MTAPPALAASTADAGLERRPSAASPASAVPACAAECTAAARAGAWLFRQRGWLPIPLLVVPLLLPGTQTAATWAAGAALLVLGEAVRLAGVAAAGTTTRRRTRTVQRLVTYGAFAWTRNPLYVGNFLVWMGVVVATGVLWFLPLAIAIFAVEYALIVRFEEGVLESHFGDEYLAYKRRTPRWVARPPAAGTVAGPHDWAEAWRSERSTFLQYVGITLALVAKAALT